MIKKKILKENVRRGVCRDVSIHIRITKKMQKFIKDNGYSQSLIFEEALKELGFKE